MILKYVGLVNTEIDKGPYHLFLTHLVAGPSIKDLNNLKKFAKQHFFTIIENNIEKH